MTMSIGAAEAFRAGVQPRHELMFSVKILR